MTRFLNLAMAVALTFTALAAAPAPAAQAAPDWRCEQRSFSSPPPVTGGTGWGHGFIGRSATGTSVHYWLMEKIHAGAGSVEYRFDSAFQIICNPFVTPTPTTLTPVAATGQPPCTSPGNYAEIVDGKIVDRQLIGAKTSVTKYTIGTTPVWITHNYRYWHSMRQDSPGVWRWHDSSVARCSLT
ncbi:hypothetical protein [Crossiella sp. CA198]|uniref:hypothetical protein n=1 Tax=Crossiella sp. CA198 TaxID=3455607 RepID=UPI003F8D5A45